MTFEYIGEPWIAWGIVILQLVFLLIVLITFILWLFKLKKAPKQMIKFYYIITILCYVFILIYLIAIIMRVYGRYIINNDSTIYTTQLATKLSSGDLIHLIDHGFYYLSCIMLYLMLIGKIYYTFEATSYSIMYDKLFLVFTVTFISTSVCIMIFLEYAFTNYYAENNWTHAQRVQGALKFALLSLDILLNFFLFFLFQNKFKQLIIGLDDERSSLEDSKTKSMSVNTSLIQLDDRQQILLRFITKHTTLFIVAITFNEIYWIFSGVVDLATATDNYKDNELIDRWTYIAQGIQGVVIAIILYLTFAVNHHEYQYCCSCCQNCFYNYFVTRTKRKIKAMRNLKIQNDIQ